MSYLRYTIKGAFPLGEVWSTTLTFDPTAEGPGWNQTVGEAQLAAAMAVTVPVSILQLLCVGVTITGARLEMRDDTSDALIGAAEANYGTPLTTTSTVKMPPQCALVISLKTNTPGGSGRGRIYWPCPGLGLVADMRMSPSGAGNILADFRTYFLGLQAAIGQVTDPDLALNLAVRSRTTKSSPHVVRLALGNVVDTQRRRRDSMPEVIATVTY